MTLQQLDDLRTPYGFDRTRKREYQYIGSSQMKESTSSLADHLATLSSSETSNAAVNRRGRSRRQRHVCSISIHVSCWTVLGGSALYCGHRSSCHLPAAVDAGGSGPRRLHGSRSVNWLPWMWIRPSFTAASAVDLVTYVQLFGKVELLNYLWVHIPLSFQSLHNAHSRTLNRFWTATFRQSHYYSTSSTPSSSSHHRVDRQILLLRVRRG
jgi:hypothetical protein